jgi:hypothetical protein
VMTSMNCPALVLSLGIASSFSMPLVSKPATPATRRPKPDGYGNLVAFASYDLRRMRGRNRSRRVQE